MTTNQLRECGNLIYEQFLAPLLPEQQVIAYEASRAIDEMFKAATTTAATNMALSYEQILEAWNVAVAMSIEKQRVVTS